MEELKNKRRQLKTSITKFKTFVDNYIHTDVLPLKVRLEKAEELWDKFGEIQTSIELLDVNEETYRDAFEDIYFEVIAKARQIIKDTQEVTINANPGRSSNTSINSINVKLPTLSLPTFSGNYADWLMFSDSFISIIDKNEGLSNIQKFQYLRGSLRNEALQIIHTLETTDQNYSVAWNMLRNRYENEMLIINTHVKNLVETTAINKESHVNLRQFIDCVRTNVNALKTLKEPVDEWNTILIYLLSSKLDWRSRQLWQDKLSTMKKDIRPTIDQFLEVLSNRSQSLEMTERGMKH